MSVTSANVRHIALLARLAITDDRAEKLTRNLNGILAHMTALAAVDTTGVEPATQSGDAGLPLRPDEGPPLSLARAREDFAPRMRDGLFLVPRLASHDTGAE